MGSNILPFALRRAIAFPARPPAVRLVVIGKTARLLLTIAPRARA